MPAGVVQGAIRNVQTGKGVDASRTGVEGATPSASPVQSAPAQPKLTVASVGQDGKVTFQAEQGSSSTKM